MKNNSNKQHKRIGDNRKLHAKESAAKHSCPNMTGKICHHNAQRFGYCST